jgi:hypothetical protein
MKLRWVYLALFVAGAVIPMTVFAPWVVQHGCDATLFVHQLFANRVSTFFALDLLLTAVAVLSLAIRDRGRIRFWWLPLVATVCIGVSAGLPLLLYLRAADGATRGEAQD